MHAMTPSQDVRFYLIPQKFWAVTEHLSSTETEMLLTKVMRLAEEQRIEELRNYDFVVVRPTVNGAERN